MSQHSLILTEQRGRVGLITLNRPESLNALSDAMGREILAAARSYDADPSVGAIVITGSSKAFAAGADIKEMAAKSSVEMYQADWFSVWDELARVRTPMIAAVAGHALGGGCELAMIADFIIAAENAKFGQPEIKLGVIAAGGSKYLPAHGITQGVQGLGAVESNQAHPAALFGQDQGVLAHVQKFRSVRRVVEWLRRLKEGWRAALRRCPGTPT